MTTSPAINVYQDHLAEQPAGTLVQIVYSSYALVGEEADDEILRVSRRNNQAADITGLLIRDGAWFMQILEGPVESVPALMCRIEADPRHRDVSISLVRLVGQRRFGDWTMCSPAVDRGGFDALVASLDQAHDATDRLISDFIADGVWPRRVEPRRRLGASLKAALDRPFHGPFRYVACASLLTGATAAGPPEPMVDEWWQQNADNDVTGILVHDDGNLLYYLEGSADAVDRIIGMMAADPRHASMITLLEGETGSRLFADCPLEVRGCDRPLFSGDIQPGGDAALRRSLAALVRGMR